MGAVQTVASAAVMMSIYYLTSVPGKYLHNSLIADDRCTTAMPFPMGQSLPGVLNEYVADMYSTRMHNPAFGNYRRVRVTAKIDDSSGLTLYGCTTPVTRLVRYTITYAGLPVADRRRWQFYEFTKTELPPNAAPAVVYTDRVADLVTVRPHGLDNVRNPEDNNRFGIIVYAIRQMDLGRAEYLMISDTLNATFTLQIPDDTKTAGVDDRRSGVHHGAASNGLFDAAYAYILNDHCGLYVNCV